MGLQNLFNNKSFGKACNKAMIAIGVAAMAGSAGVAIKNGVDALSVTGFLNGAFAAGLGFAFHRTITKAENNDQQPPQPGA